MNLTNIYALDRIDCIENGRFTKLFIACSSFNDVCFKCGYFDSTKKEMYRCHVMGDCPAASLNKKMIDYILKHINKVLIQ